MASTKTDRPRTASSTPLRHRARLCCAVFAATPLLVGSLAGRAKAAAYFWNSAGATYNWSEGANWSTGFAPVNDGTSELFFGALSVAYLANADLKSGAQVENFINRIVFLPSAGAYTVAETPNPGGPGNIHLYAGGIINESNNLQTFEAPVLTANVQQTINAGNGGIRFADSSGFWNAGPIFTGGSGAITCAGLFTSVGPINTTVYKTGANTLNFDAGVTMLLSAFSTTGGTTAFRGNQAGSGNRIFSITLGSGASSTITNNADVVLGRSFAPPGRRCR
jgi:hypothetical protein